MAQHYKDLIVWQKSMDLANAIYDATDAFPKRETYSLTDQMRRAAVSSPATLRRDKHTIATVNFVTFFAIRVDPWPS
jgi:four helix bundle protein